MRYLVNSREMKQYDKTTVETYGIPSMVLMERAALAFTEAVFSRNLDTGRVLVVCGSGNNGGDGYAVARLLWQRGSRDTEVACGSAAESAENKALKAIWTAYGNPVLAAIPEDEEYTLIVDAIFGIGLARTVEGEYRACIEKMNAMSGCRVAVDIPSGICADSGAVLGSAFAADYTVTFAFEKLGLVLWPGSAYAGEVLVKDIGIDARSFPERGPSAAVLEPADLARLPRRRGHSNKGDYGKVLVAAGSPGMAGAAYFCAKAAYAAGAGLVRIFTPEENRAVLAGLLPEAVLTVYAAQDPDTALLRDAMRWADVIAAGPGLGTSAGARAIVREILDTADRPTVLDADALNLIAEDTNLLRGSDAARIVTPHPGEMSRLTGNSVDFILNHLKEVAEEFAEQYNVVCVLKDEHTVIGLPGGMTWLNLSGNAGMATAGSGDVLTGVIAALAAQGMTAGEAAAFGVCLHGLSGDAAAAKTGMRGLMASDLIDGLRSPIEGGMPCGMEKNHEQI